MLAKWTRNMIGVIALLAVASAILPWYSHYLSEQSLRQAELGRAAESHHLARKAVSYNPLSVDALIVLAGAQQRLGRAGEARTSLLKATELQPQNYITWEQLAIYERDFWNDPAGAQAHIAQAARLNRFDERLRLIAGDQG